MLATQTLSHNRVKRIGSVEANSRVTCGIMRSSAHSPEGTLLLKKRDRSLAAPGAPLGLRRPRLIAKVAPR